MKPRRTQLVLRRRAVARPAAMPWRLIEHARNVHELRFAEVRSGHRLPILLSSDQHWDNPKCNRALLRQHLQEALELKAPVVIAGDFFCAMQGKYDPRSSKKDLRPEHQTTNYLDALVEDAAQWLAPYAAVLAIIGPGNHETSILKRHETNLTERLVERIRALRPDSPVRVGGYSGWVRLSFRVYGTCVSHRLWYHHGYGGGGPVTKGTIQTNRRAVYAQADVILTGHTHDAWEFPIARIELSEANRVHHTEQLHICTPGYKEDYEDGFGGWEVERGSPPKPIGACWLDCVYRRPGIVLEALRAKPGVMRTPRKALA